MLHEDRPVDADRHTRHLAAVQRSLDWADEAAQAGDYGEALRWLDVVEAVGTELSADHRTKRDVWRRAARGRRGSAAGDLGATEPARSAAATLSYLHCPRCRLAIAQKVAWLGMTHCPRCVARDRVAIELFSSTLPPDELYAEP